MFATLMFAVLQVTTPATAPLIRGPQPGQLHVSVFAQDSNHHYYPMYQTYAREGALIVGIPFGLLTGALIRGLCHYSDLDNVNCGTKGLVSGVAAGGIMGLIGALIGSSFHRNPMIPDSVVGDRALPFGLAFAGSGLVLGAVISHGDCRASCFGPTVKGGLLSAVAGGAIGYGLGSLFPKYFRR